MRGELDFEAALLERLEMLKGLPVTALGDVFEKRITLTPGARTLVRTMRKRGATTALVSGGFTYFTSRVAAAAGFDVNEANELLAAEGRLAGDVARPIRGRKAKEETLVRLSIERGIPLAETLAVGDGANDLGMLGRAGLGVAFHAKPAVAAAAGARIDHGDLTALLYLQGVAKTDFVD
jgi:phosphoserine phosphatase